MPLILISGYPLSGKTYRAKQLETYLMNRIAEASDPKHKNLSVVHVSDDTLGINRSVYDAARTEKDARGTLSSAVKRHLGKDVIVICDAMNYIKGFRYQLFCEAKAVPTASCVVHVGTPIEKCKELNEQRLAGTAPENNSSSAPPEPSQSTSSTQPETSSESFSSVSNPASSAPPPDSSTPKSPPGYEPSLFDNLVFRYEEPNGMTRWDSPLFTVLYEDPEPPNEAIWDALIGGKARAIRPNMATVTPAAAPSDALQQMEHTTSAITSAILATLSDNPDADSVKVPEVKQTVNLPPTQKVNLPMLQRLKRQFLQIQRSNYGKLGGDGTGVTGNRVAEAFVGFLNGAWGTEDA